MNTISEIKKELEPNFDENGLIVHIQDGGQKNGGDCCSRMGSYYFFLRLLNENYGQFGNSIWYEYSQALDKLQVQSTDDQYIRHPNKGYHCGVAGFTNYDCWSLPSNFSIDQTRGLIVGMSALSFIPRLKKFFWATIRRGSRCQNGDILFLSEYGVFIRAFNWWFLYPLLFICDMWLCLGNLFTIGKLYFSLLTAKNDQSYDCNGYIEGLLMSLHTRQRLPTPFGWLSRKIISHRVEWAWSYYFRHEGCPRLDLFIPLVKGFL